MIKIFLSWSGSKSEKMCQYFKDWFPKLQKKNAKFEFYFSPDTDKGSIAMDEIDTALKESCISVVFLTKENLNRPWLLFEAGAVCYGNLAQNKPVCCYLIDLEKKDIPEHNPLKMFQHTSANMKEDTKRLLLRLKNTLPHDEQLSERYFNQRFEDYWDELKTKLDELNVPQNPIGDPDYSISLIHLFNNYPPLYKENSDKTILNRYLMEQFNEISNLAIGRRLQFIVDRAVFIMYLDTEKIWWDKLTELKHRMADKDILPDEQAYAEYNILAIDILRQVFYYHEQMRKTAREYEHPEAFDIASIKDALEKLEQKMMKHDLQVNYMLQCLLFDYLGLVNHKFACTQLGTAIQKKQLYVGEPDHLDALKNISDTSARIAAETLHSAIAYFNKVLKIAGYSPESFKPTTYIWDSYALYNKARCEYILYLLGYQEYSVWENTMKLAVNKRKKDYFEDYYTLPKAIVSDLHAEYLHAYLEQCDYANILPDQRFEEAYKIYQDEYYNDVLRVNEKRARIKKKLKPHTAD